MRYHWVLLLALAAGCREGDGPLEGSGTGTLIVESDPAGAAIIVDGRSTGRVTPDTLRNIGGLRDVRVELDTGGVTYSYRARVVVDPAAPVVLSGPVVAGCIGQVSDCGPPYHREHTAAGLRFATNALGALFLRAGQGGGLYWPANTQNSYLSTGMPVVAGTWDDQRVSLGAYDAAFLAGRPAPVVTQTAERYETWQRGWVLPPVDLLPLRVARGLEVRERVVASEAEAGVLLVELTFRNVSSEPLYRRMDPLVPATGITYTDAYVGLVLDPDVGQAEDDWLSYDPDLQAVFAYDSDFRESGFGAQQATPALLGLRVLRAPAGAGVVLNGWVSTAETPDWAAGTSLQYAGHGMLSGTESYAPDHPGALVGHLPPAAGDARMSATVGPLQLAPGDSATLVLAVALAAPAAGTYTSGERVAPGTPGDSGRALHAIAAGLRARLVAAEALLGLLQD